MTSATLKVLSRPEAVREAARAFATAHGHHYGRGSSTVYGCECDRCGHAMTWSDAGAWVLTGATSYLGSLAQECTGAGR